MSFLDVELQTKLEQPVPILACFKISSHVLKFLLSPNFPKPYRTSYMTRMISIYVILLPFG